MKVVIILLPYMDKNILKETGNLLERGENPLPLLGGFPFSTFAFCELCSYELCPSYFPPIWLQTLVCEPYINTKFKHSMNAKYYRRRIELISEDRRDNPFMKLWDLLGDVDTGEYNTKEDDWKADLAVLRLTLIEILNNRIVEEYEKM